MAVCAYKVSSKDVGGHSDCKQTLPEDVYQRSIGELEPERQAELTDVSAYGIRAVRSSIVKRR